MLRKYGYAFSGERPAIQHSLTRGQHISSIQRMFPNNNFTGQGCMVEGTSLKFQPFETVLRLAEHDVLNSCPSLQLSLDCGYQMAASQESTSHKQSHH